jgi:hypothetical protein
MRSDETRYCVSQDAQACFALSSAVEIMDLWRLSPGFPLSRIPVCKEIKAYLAENDEIFGVSEGYRRQMVEKFTGEPALHPLCVSPDHYRKGGIGYLPSGVPPGVDLRSRDSISGSVDHIASLLTCSYRNCSVITFRPYEKELEQIDSVRKILQPVSAHLEAKKALEIKLRWAGITLVVFALALRLTKTSATFLAEKRSRRLKPLEKEEGKGSNLISD